MRSTWLLALLPAIAALTIPDSTSWTRTNDETTFATQTQTTYGGSTPLVTVDDGAFKRGGNTANYYGTTDTANYYGTADTANYYGTADTANYYGTTDTANYYGTIDTANYYGTSPGQAEATSGSPGGLCGSGEEYLLVPVYETTTASGPNGTSTVAGTATSSTATCIAARTGQPTGGTGTVTGGGTTATIGATQSGSIIAAQASSSVNANATDTSVRSSTQGVGTALAAKSYASPVTSYPASVFSAVVISIAGGALGALATF